MYQYLAKAYESTKLAASMAYDIENTAGRRKQWQCAIMMWRKSVNENENNINQ
jgi:hypothetical protein